jgi:capsular polysaccharide transport system permease protein
VSLNKYFSLFRNKLFLLCVALPTLLASIYYGLIASDVYISQSSFVVRTPEKQVSSALGQILQGAGFTSSQGDAYTVDDYILSRDAMQVLNKKLDLKQKFSSPEVDPVSRFGGLIDWHTSFEAFYKYYLKMVGVKLDPLSSIITLQTKAFTANDALAMDANLLELSEHLVNLLNERGQQDMIQFAQKNFDKAEKKSKDAALALGKYRNQFGVINPEQQSAIPLQQIAKLQDQLIVTQAQILQIQTLSKENPQLPSLRQRAQLLEAEIAKETARVAGSNNQSLASKAIEYQRLSLDSQFADRELVSTMASLEQARTEAQRQQLYLERIAQPSLPDKAMEPRRLRAVLAVFVLGLALWGILTMLISGIREHQD